MNDKEQFQNLQSQYQSATKGSQRNLILADLYTLVHRLSIKTIKTHLKSKVMLPSDEIDDIATEIVGYILSKVARLEIITNISAYTFLTAKKFLYERSKQERFEDESLSFNSLLEDYGEIEYIPFDVGYKDKQ